MRCGKMRVERGHSGRSARSLVSPRTRRALVAGAWGSPWSPLIRAIKPSGPHAVAEPKFLLPVVVLPLLGDVMAKLINDLLLLTCMGALIASATDAVTLLH